MRGAYYNEIDRKAAAWLRELIRRGLIAPIPLGQGQTAGSAYGRSVHGRLDRAPTPFPAICSCESCAMHHCASGSVCGQRQVPDSRRKTDRPWGRLDCCGGNESGCFVEGVLPWCVNGKPSCVPVAASGTREHCAQHLRDGRSPSIATCSPVLCRLETHSRKPGRCGHRQPVACHALSHGPPCTPGNRTYEPGSSCPRCTRTVRSEYYPCHHYSISDTGRK